MKLGIYFLFLGITQGAWSADFPGSVVKTQSGFSGSIGSQLEGSGLVFRWNNSFYVLTSEHVILPSNDKATHFIEHKNPMDDNEGCRIQVRFVDSSWDKGLALLALNDQATAVKCFANAPTLAELQQPVGNGPVIAIGSPVGTHDFVEKQNGRFVKFLSPGEILFSQSVAYVENLAGEYGMSGGPAILGDRFFGVISQRNTQTNSETFIIPAADATGWVIHRPAPIFRRSPEDFGKLSFSISETERVTHVASGMIFFKKGPLLYMREGNPPADPYHDPFYVIRQNMHVFDFKMMAVDSINDVTLPEGTLEHWMYLVFSNLSKVDFVDSMMEQDFGPQGSFVPITRGRI